MLRKIIETVGSRGLKSSYLRKHKRPVVRFLDSVASRDFLSSLATNYKRRFQKSGLKMFTFWTMTAYPGTPMPSMPLNALPSIDGM
jgi:hypothetical protein